MTLKNTQPYEHTPHTPIHIGEILADLDGVLSANTEPDSPETIELNDLLAEHKEATDALQVIEARREAGEELPGDPLERDRMAVQALATQRQLNNRQKPFSKEE